MKAREIMTPQVVGVGPGHGIRHAVSIMLEHRISGLPVLDDDGHLVGILTEGDLLRREELGAASDGKGDADVTPDEAATAYVRARSWRVSDVMSRNVVTIDEDAPITRICRLMLDRDVNRLPVVRGERVVGIVSRSDLLRVIAAAGVPSVAAGDEALRCAVRARLSSDLDLEDVAVEVDRGYVTLAGGVPTRALQDAARVAAESVPGVAGVTDRLSVSGTGGEE